MEDAEESEPTPAGVTLDPYRHPKVVLAEPACHDITIRSTRKACTLLLLLGLQLLADDCLWLVVVQRFGVAAVACRSCWGGKGVVANLKRPIWRRRLLLLRTSSCRTSGQPWLHRC